MKFKPLIISAGIVINASAVSLAQDVSIVPATIKSAVVYKQGATLTHKVPVNVARGNHEIVIRNVANQIDEKSIQVNAPAHLTIMSVSFTRHYKEQKDNTIVLPNTALQQARRTLTQIVNKRLAEENTLQLLQNNQQISGTQTGITVAELSKLTEFYKKQQLGIRDSIALYQEQEQLQRNLIAQLERESGVAYTPAKEEGGYIVLQVMANQAVNQDITINYLTPSASWYPTYDFKIANTNQPLNIVYKGNVSQTTGIDWKQTTLSLSTNNPTQGNTAPEVTPWFLSYGRNVTKYNGEPRHMNAPTPKYNSETKLNDAEGQPGANASVRIRGFSSIDGGGDPLIVLDGAPYTGKLSDINPNDIASVEILKDATATSLYGSRGANGVTLITTKNKGMNDYTEVVEKELNATFDISLPYDIASTGKQHSIILKDVKHPAMYDYFAAPKLDKDAFLMAKVTNIEKLQLMPGEANIILNNTYIGKTWINPLIAKDTINFSVGRDKKIIIERKTILEKNNTKVLSGNKREVFTYDIIVKNTKNETAKLMIKEPYPIATESTMEVELLESSKADVDKEKGLMTWNIDLKPNESKTIRVSYSVKYPTNQVIGNLR